MKYSLCVCAEVGDRRVGREQRFYSRRPDRWTNMRGQNVEIRNMIKKQRVLLMRNVPYDFLRVLEPVNEHRIEYCTAQLFHRLQSLCRELIADRRSKNERMRK